LNSSDGW